MAGKADASDWKASPFFLYFWGFGEFSESPEKFSESSEKLHSFQMKTSVQYFANLYIWQDMAQNVSLVKFYMRKKVDDDLLYYTLRTSTKQKQTDRNYSSKIVLWMNFEDSKVTQNMCQAASIQRKLKFRGFNSIWLLQETPILLFIHVNYLKLIFINFGINIGITLDLLLILSHFIHFHNFQSFYFAIDFNGQSSGFL